MRKNTINLEKEWPLFTLFLNSNTKTEPELTENQRVNIFANKHSILRSILFVCLNLMFLGAYAQVNIFELMNRSDLKLNEIENIADEHFAKVGTGKGSGYKQYQRWLYERKFHVNEEGNYIEPQFENEQYQKFVSNQKQNKAVTTIWKELGPTSWSTTTGWNPGIGRITSVAIHPSDTTVIYVGSPGGGLWKSANSGLTWAPLLDFINFTWLHVNHICIDPSNKNTIYTSVGNIIKSTNAGATWTSTGNGPTSSRKVIVSPNNSNLVYSASGNGIFVSTNGGTTWTKTLDYNVEDIEFNPANPNMLYASGSTSSGSVWKSTDGGINWTLINSTAGITATGRTLLAVSPHNPSIVYAVQANGSAFGKMYRSNDSGSTFTTLITGNPANGTNYFGYESDGKGSGGQATYDMAICVNPKNANEVHIAGIICWKSINGGASFIPETEWYYPNPIGYNHADVHVLEWVKGTIYSGSDGGIYKSVNKGGDWIDLSKGIGIRQVYRVSCAKTNVNVINTGAQDNGSTIRQTTGQWKDWLGGDGMDNLISPTNENFAIGTAQNGYLFKTTDGGKTMTSLERPSSGNWITPIAMHPTNHDTIFAGWQGVWKSVNGGIKFNKISGSYIPGSLNCLVIAPTNTKYIYASINNILYRTNNGGITWTSVNLPTTITSICVSPVSESKIWLTFNSTSTRIYVSDNMGDNFTDISSGLPNMSARSVVVDDNLSEGIYLGMNIGVYYKDKNTPWTILATGLPLVAINDIEIQKSGGKVRIATYGRGIWETDMINQDDCNAPTSLSATNITANSAVVSWTPVAGAKNYDVEYKEETSSNWNIAATGNTNPFLTINGLNPGKTYDWRVKTNCNYSSSPYAVSKITTECLIPTDLTANGIIYNAADLNWTPVPGALSYTIQYKPSTSSNWIASLNSDNPFITLNTLNAGTKYDWQIKSNCPSESSDPASSNFITLCVEPSNASSSSSSVGTASLSWTNVNGAVDYGIEYKASATSAWSSFTTSDTFYNLSNLATGLYDWRVATNCAEGSQGYLNSEFMVYCISEGSLTNLEFIRYVGLGSLNRYSRSDDGIYREQNAATVLVPGQTYVLKFAAAMPDVNKQNRQHYWRFFLDYNRNGYVYDSDELIGSKYLQDTLEHEIAFTVPANAVLGKTLLRASLKMGSWQNPCNPIKFGEVEDYYVELTNSPTHAVPGKIQPGISDINVYPIPANEAFNLNYTLSEKTKNLTITLTDLIGKVHYEDSQAKAQGSHSESISVNNLIHGIYYLTLKTEKYTKVQKIIITD
jgi:hypothetical protein